MGFGNYSHEAHQAITQARAGLAREDVFKQTSCHPLMNPKGVRARESRDGATHPNSLGIVFALDVTGSMGEIPEMLARRELPTFMNTVLALGIADPQVLFMAVGDATSDNAPLQVGQFESAAREMDHWLTCSFLEGGGGGGGHESYELALYFAARHTEMDCWVKRKKRGYLILTGDELPYPRVSNVQVASIIGDDLGDDLALARVVAAAEQTFASFFLIPDLARRSRCERVWRDVLGDRVICMESAADTCHVAAGIVALGERAVSDLDALAKRMSASGVAADRIGAVVRALTPFAATLGRDGIPAPRVVDAPLPSGDAASGMQRR
jgi:hypothetical protein